MISVDARLATRRIDALVKELKYLNSETFLRGLSLSSQADRAVTYLKSVFPEGDSPHSVNEFGMHLKDGFLADYFVQGSKIGFGITHVLIKNKRAQTVLKSLDTGSRAFSYVAEKTLRFLAEPGALGKRRTSKRALLWVTIAEGQKVDRGRREGTFYVDKTEEFIKRVIIPEVREDFDYKVSQRIKRI